MYIYFKPQTFISCNFQAIKEVLSKEYRLLKECSPDMITRDKDFFNSTYQAMKFSQIDVEQNDTTKDVVK